MNNYSGHNEPLNPHPEQNQFLPIKREKKHKHSDPNRLVTIYSKKITFSSLSIRTLLLLRRGLDLKELQICWQKVVCSTSQ